MDIINHTLSSLSGFTPKDSTQMFPTDYAQVKSVLRVGKLRAVFCSVWMLSSTRIRYHCYQIDPSYGRMQILDHMDLWDGEVLIKVQSRFVCLSKSNSVS